MARDVSSGLLAQCDADTLAPIYMASIGTAGGTVRMWTGIGTIVWGGEEFIGGGDLVGVAGVEERYGSTVQAGGTTFSLKGVDPDMLSIALGEIRQGLPAKLWFAALDLEAGALHGDPLLVFSGLTDIPTIDDGGDTVTISITAENRLIDLERARVRRFTPEDQKAQYPGDKGFDFVASIQEAEISWGSGLP